ncbi:MAG: polysaccharide deacetylase family protein [Eubacterium sp.]
MKRLLYVVGVFVLLGLMVWQWQKNASSEVAEVVATSPEPSEKIAYLTFDDGPSEITPNILDTLKKYDAKATFFLIGEEITKDREAIIRREVEEGHSVGVHTYCHKKDEMYCNKQYFWNDFEKCKTRIEEVTGDSVSLHRFPWGSNNGYVCPIVDELMGELQKRKITSFDWNVSGEDSVGVGVPMSCIYQNVKKDLDKYTSPIILLHDSATMKNTAAVLPEILQLIREKGYRFDTLANREGYVFPKSWR